MRIQSSFVSFLACFSVLSAAPLASAVDVEILFRVDMNQRIANTEFDPAVDIVTVRASFNSWTGCDPMDDSDADGIYEKEIQLTEQTAGTTLEFKFNQCSIDKWEDAISNRTITVEDTWPDTDADGFLEASYTALFDVAGEIGAERVNVEVTFLVDMQTQIDLDKFDPATQSPVVRGDFNTWGCTDPMLDPDLDATYEIEIQLMDVTVGSHPYKFNVDCSDTGWETRDNRMYTITGTEPDDDSDGLLEVKVGPFDFDDVPASAMFCDAELIFQVNMNVQIANDNFDPVVDTVVVRGGFNGWGCSDPMLDPEEDGIYTLEIPQLGFRAADVNEFKFNINCDETRWETRDNRSYEVTCEEPDEDSDGLKEVVIPLVEFDDVTDEDILIFPVTAVFSVNALSVIRALEAGVSFTSINGPPVTVTPEDLDNDNINVGVNGFFKDWNWGGFDADQFLNDFGEGFDEEEGDFIYTGGILLPAGTSRDLVFKYSVNEGDDEAGFAENHEFRIETTDPNDDVVFLPTVCYGENNTDINLPFGNVGGAFDCAPPGTAFLRGDSNSNGTLDIGDPIINLGHQFLGDQVLCRDALDYNDSNSIDISDPVSNLSHQFLGLEPPAAPGKEECGVDPTDDDGIDCETYPEDNC